MSDELTKVSFLAGQRTMDALHRAAERCGDNETDTINRAIQLYDAITATAERGGRLDIEHLDGMPLLRIYVAANRPRRHWWRRRPPVIVPDGS